MMARTFSRSERDWITVLSNDVRSGSCMEHLRTQRMWNLAEDSPKLTLVRDGFSLVKWLYYRSEVIRFRESTRSPVGLAS